MTSVAVTSVLNSDAPFNGLWETPMLGYANAAAPSGAVGSCTPTTFLGVTLWAVGIVQPAANPTSFMLVAPPGTSQTFFSAFTVTLAGGSPVTFTNAASTFTLRQSNGSIGGGGANIPTWTWTVSDPLQFSAGLVTTLAVAAPSPPPGNGDIPNPEAWQDSLGNIPPLQFGNVPTGTNYALNGDGRYWFSANANTPSEASNPIVFIGNPDFLTGTVSLQWTVTQVSPDGSGLVIAYSTNGSTFTMVTVLPQTQREGLQSGNILISLAGATSLTIQVFAQGGTASPTAIMSEVAIAITRNANEGLSWDFPDPFDPINYNCACMDQVVPTDTLLSLRTRIMTRLGFASQAANPLPGMKALVNDFLSSGQAYLYKRYSQLHTRRLFRWKVSPGQRFYSIKDNDDDILCNFTMDPTKAIEWAGIQDSRNVWYPLIEGIPPQLYTMITKPWRPARYEIRQCIELYPAPDQTYWLWFKAHFGLLSFALDTDSTTIDAELVFLHALANAKAHYGQPDANNIESQANAYRAQLIAGTHGTSKYIPGTIAVPPAVRPTLIQFQDNQSG